jgi:predicted dehydrogenase
MHHKKVILFLILATIFAVVHYFAVLASLYWYHWWFDIFMHFWGGLLIGLGVHALCTLQSVSLKPTLILVLVTLATATGVWEIFEWFAGLWDPETYIYDTAQDVLLGFGGGLLAHLILTKRTIEA